jgi:hypothetical protein
LYLSKVDLEKICLETASSDKEGPGPLGYDISKLPICGDRIQMVDEVE